MAVRSRAVVVRDTLPVGVVTDVYTVPVDRTLVVRAWSFHNRTSVAREVRLHVRRGADSVAVGRSSALAAGGVVADLDCSVVLNPGDVLAAFNGSENTQIGVGVFVAGSLLQGAPA